MNRPLCSEENDMMKQAVAPELEGLPELKPEDVQFFSKLLQVHCRVGGTRLLAAHAELSIEEAKERKIMKLLLKARPCRICFSRRINGARPISVTVLCCIYSRGPAVLAGQEWDAPPA
jgi:hypothetical protein